MAEIIIRDVSLETERRLLSRAARHGKTLEADLWETLEELARAEAELEQVPAAFGSWLVSLSRPGADLDKAIDLLRSATLRSAELG